GFIDCHVHLTMEVGKGWDVEAIRTMPADAAILGTVNALRTLRAGFTSVRNVADRGGESVAVAANGNVYLANGQVLVYAPDGKQIGQIEVPDRPLQILFGGNDRRTLFILTHHALYAVETR
ncbi:MAG TPA: SMP-30/gluconolactonase/LRE family protein, partial [Rhizomicrobium sp.]|nr:SMP-30/gluconolactonase/LRE family protein [Rhizomicrobium sp.]